MLSRGKISHLSLAALLAGIVSASQVNAATIVTSWSMENITITGSPGTDNGPYTSDGGTVTGNVSGHHAAAATVWSTVAGNGSAKSFSSNTWAVGDYYQFTTNLTGVTGSQFEIDQTASSTGPLNFKVQTSTDGVSFVDLPSGAYALNSATSFSTGSTNSFSPPRFLFDISTLDGVATAFVRVVDTTAPSGSAGTSRIDNATIGTSLTPPTVPEPASMMLLAAGTSLVLIRRRSRA